MAAIFGPQYGTGAIFGQQEGSAATALTMTGPGSGSVGAASTAFTVGANGAVSGGVIYTPSDAGGGGTFTPVTGTPPGTFTYTPDSSGVKTISITNSGGLTNPASLAYTANAVAAATSQITMAVLGEDAVISASLLGGVLPITPGSAPTSSTASTRHSLKRLAAATDICVTLAEAKLHCRVDGVLEDFLITAYIQAATEAAEQLTGRAIMPQIWQLTHDGFPALFELTRPNVLSIVSLTYIDATGATQSLTPADYSLDASDDYGFAYVVPAWDVTWPAAGGQMNSVLLTYQAGYASAAQVPASVKAWVLLMTAALYNNRELEGTQQTHSLGRADVLLDSVKVWSI